MPVGTDMGGFPQVGIVPRLNPVTGDFDQWKGITLGRSDLRVPRVMDFQQVGTLTATDCVDRMTVAVPHAVTNLRMLLINVPGFPYTIEVMGATTGSPVNTDAILLGLCGYDGTKVVTLYMMTLGGQWKYSRDNWNTVTGTVATARAVSTIFNPNAIWMRLSDDGTNRTWNYSVNGKDWCTIYSEATGTFAVPTKVGITLYNNSANSIVSKVTIYHFQVYAGIMGDAP